MCVPPSDVVQLLEHAYEHMLIDANSLTDAEAAWRHNAASNRCQFEPRESAADVVYRLPDDQTASASYPAIAS